MDVVIAAWAAAGRPRAGLAQTQGRCARCGQAGPVMATGAVLSGKFTAWDDWADPAGAGLCQPCTWAYRTAALRARPTYVTADPPSLAHPTLAALAVLLQAALPPAAAVAVPLKPGRKHVLPGARWATVATGDACLPWTSLDGVRLQAMLRLRVDGFGSRMLAAPAPSFPVLRRLPAARQAGVLQDWAAVGPWRARPPWLDLALRLTAPHPVAP